MALFIVGSGISETDSHPTTFDEVENENVKNTKQENGKSSNGGVNNSSENGKIINYAVENVAPVFEEVDLNSCGSSNASSDETHNPPTIDAIVQQIPPPKSIGDASPNRNDTLHPHSNGNKENDTLHPLSNGNEKNTFDRSVSSASSGSGKSTPKQKISWGQVNDIPVPDSFPNEREENHVSRNELSLNSAKLIPDNVSESEARSFHSFFSSLFILVSF